MPTSTTSREESRRTVREVVGRLPDPEALDVAVSDLLVKDFDRRDLSVLSTAPESADAMHEVPAGTAKLEDNPRAPHTVHMSKASLGDAEGGIIGGVVYVGATAAAGAAATAGAGVGAIVTATVIAGGLGGSSSAGRAPDGSTAAMLPSSTSRSGAAGWCRGFGPRMRSMRRPRSRC